MLYEASYPEVVEWELGPMEAELQPEALAPLAELEIFLERF